MAQPFDVIIMELGGRGRFHPPAAVAADFCRLVVSNPTAEIGIAISGYDSDARELFDVPEVMIWLREFAAAVPDLIGDIMTSDEFLARLDQHSRVLMLLAAGVIERHQIRVEGNA